MSWLLAAFAALTHLFTGLGHADLRAPDRQASRSTQRTPLPDPDPTGEWDRLAGCEATGDWQTNTGNGYYGGLQLTAGSWTTYGGNAFAALPSDATRTQQITVARSVEHAQGWAAWPYCSLKEGLR